MNLRMFLRTFNGKTIFGTGLGTLIFLFAKIVEDICSCNEIWYFLMITPIIAFTGLFFYLAREKEPNPLGLTSQTALQQDQ